MLEKCTAAALEAAFNSLFGDNQKYGDYDELERSLIDQLEGIAEEEIESVFSNWI